VATGALQKLEKTLLLTVLDEAWLDHLAAMDHLRQGIRWRGYAQRDPKQEYKREAFELFATMLEDVKREAVSLLAKVRVPNSGPMENQGTSSVARMPEKAERNAPCPCGSGKKYKQCHGS
jgi:preprotein translocase subunit SecA